VHPLAAENYEAELKTALPVAGFGEPLRFFDEVGSTNDEALEWAREGAPEGGLVVADRQTAGRGRRGRTWHAPKGLALLFSVVLRPGLSPDRLGLLTTALGVAGAEAALALGVDARVKWPNDVVVEGKKLAGVLVESRLGGSRVEAAIAGMGFNVSVDPGDLPEDLSTPATSLAVELGEAPSRPETLARVLESFAPIYRSLAAAPDAVGLLARAEELSAVIGSTVDVRMGDGSLVTGDARGLTDTGALVVTGGRGDVVVSAGEIESLRPA
jgi:BirA family biotin operon repressor/biotin-[acetyl-CoA-carboxylase] ligase